MDAGDGLSPQAAPGPHCSRPHAAAPPPILRGTSRSPFLPPPPQETLLRRPMEGYSGTALHHSRSPTHGCVCGVEGACRASTSGAGGVRRGQEVNRGAVPGRHASCSRVGVRTPRRRASRCPGDARVLRTPHTYANLRPPHIRPCPAQLASQPAAAAGRPGRDAAADGRGGQLRAGHAGQRARANAEPDVSSRGGKPNEFTFGLSLARVCK